MLNSQPSQDNLGAVDKVQRFRILVIGNANAGKTTILNKVCNGKVCNLLSSILLGKLLTSCPLKTDLDKPTAEVHSHNHFYSVELIKNWLAWRA